MKNAHTDFGKISIGFYIFCAVHERTGEEMCQLALKSTEAAWHEQISIPTYSEEACGNLHQDFWQWAKANLPVYRYTKMIKSA